MAVVGRSGAGKSTLARVLLRLAPYQGGSVTLDGIELSELDGDACRRVVGMLSQDAHMFDTTIRANLRLARREADDEQLREAVGAARLGAWLDGLPAGLDTQVGELGERLSGGERQRLAAARVSAGGLPGDGARRAGRAPGHGTRPTRSSPTCSTPPARGRSC